MAIQTSAILLDPAKELVFTASNGAVGVPQALIIYNNDLVTTVYVGGSDLDASNGIPVLAGGSIDMFLYAGEEAWCLADTGTPEIRILATMV